MGLLRPAVRLPYDILRELFAQCQSEDDYLMNMRNNIRLSLVCRAWRITAYSSGHLWSDIHLDPFDTDGLRIIDTFLKRSNTRLNLSVDHRFWDRAQNAALEFWLEDFPFSRVQRLRINSNPNFKYGRESLWQLEMPSLTQLVIFVDMAQRNEEVHGDVLGCFPTLQSLKLYWVNLRFQTLFILPKLTMIKWDAEVDSQHSLAGLMKRAPNLESFSLGGPSRLDVDSPLAEVAFPPLDSLVQLEFNFPRISPSIRSLLQSDVHLSSIQHVLLSWTEPPVAVDSGLFIRYSDVTALNKLTIRLRGWLNADGIEKSLASFPVLRHLQHIAHLLIEMPDSPEDEDWEYLEQRSATSSRVAIMTLSSRS